MRPPSCPPCFSLAAGFLLAALSLSRGATEVCGTLHLAAEWTAAGSPYVVTGDIFIPRTSRLRIGPGVAVRFATPRPCPTETDAPPQMDWSDSAYSGIKVEGTFYCLGSEEEPVVFQPLDSGDGRARWDGIRLTGQGASTAEISFSVFRRANQAIYAEKSVFFVHNCLFEDNNTGIHLEDRGDATVLNCNFIANRSAGIYVRKSNPRIANNLFVDNRSYGIWADGRPSIRIRNNAFWQNREEHCFHCPFPALEPGKGKPDKDTPSRGAHSDGLGNLIADPVFLDSPSHHAALQADPRTDTPPHLIKDPALARLEAKSRAKWQKPRAPFQPLGKGLYRLSSYSTLIDAGHPGPDFRDRDGSRNDIGWHGGPLGRITKDPF